MTREEKQKAINALKISVPIKALTQEEFKDYIQTLNRIMDWLEQETVPRESYEHEYFLRKEFELKIDKLQRQFDKIRAEIAELDNKVCQQFLIEDVDKEVHRAYQDCLDIIDKAESDG